jgi:GTP-binding protein
MPFADVTFITSAWQPRQFPPDAGAEVAFAGRSNAGKSSALNAITGRTNLARISKTPGRTQLLNFFSAGESRRLVDLPGYGYAKVPAKMQAHWRELMAQYVSTRVSLAGMIIVMDARRPLGEFDQQMLAWTRAHEVPVHVLLTKADKLNRGAATLTLRTVRASLQTAETAQLFSAVERTGIDEARVRVDELLAGSPHQDTEGGKKNPDDWKSSG